MSKRSTIISFAVLVLLLTAGAAQGLSGSNTVFSDDIVDGTITHADIKPNSLGGSRFLDGSVTGAKILDNTVRAADVDEGNLRFPCGHSAGPSFATINTVAVPIDEPYGTTGVQASRNCSGEAVHVRRIGTGNVCVKFIGSPQTRAVVTLVGVKGTPAVDTFAGSTACGAPATPGQFHVLVGTESNTPAAIDFNILAF